MDINHVKFPDGREHRFDNIYDALWALWEATGNVDEEARLKWIGKDREIGLFGVDENGDKYDLEPINRIKPSQY